MFVAYKDDRPDIVHQFPNQLLEPVGWVALGMHDLLELVEVAGVSLAQPAHDDQDVALDLMSLAELFSICLVFLKFDHLLQQE